MSNFKSVSTGRFSIEIDEDGKTSLSEADMAGNSSQVHVSEVALEALNEAANRIFQLQEELYPEHDGIYGIEDEAKAGSPKNREMGFHLWEFENYDGVKYKNILLWIGHTWQIPGLGGYHSGAQIINMPGAQYIRPVPTN